MVTKLVFISLLVLGGESALSPQTARAIRESENLSLLKDRLPACTVLIRTIKKANKDESKILHEKLNQLSRYFYTDKGFQNYLLGKDLFEKQKFADSLDKLSEAEEYEKGNIDVLHYLELSQLWLKKGSLADLTNKKALQINPFDQDILKDELVILIDSANWVDALKVGEALNKENNDMSGLTLYLMGFAQMKLENKGEALKLMTQALSKDANIPELYFNLASNWGQGSLESMDTTKLMTKYIDICTSKTLRVVERDPSSCSHLAEAQAMGIKPSKIEKSKTTP